MIYIVSSKKAGALGLEKAAWAEILPKFPPASRLQAPDQVYLDVSGLSGAELKKSLSVFKKQCAGFFCGIIDPKGSCEDAALFFFDGFCDYIGSALVKKGLSKKRFDLALSREQTQRLGGAGKQDTEKSEDAAAPAAVNAEQIRKGNKLPTGKFEGWKSIKTGTCMNFFFLYAAISEKSDLHNKIGEANFKVIKNRFRDVLNYYLHDAEALLWMESEDNCLFLVPPRSANGKYAIEASLKLLMNNRLIGIERLGLSFPVDFAFAIHYGKSTFSSPGKTGFVISEAVNYIFHLGTKKAETGRLTISGDVPHEAIPEGFMEILKPIGCFEGIPISNTRRFVIKK